MGHWRKIRASYLFLGGERNATISGHVIDKIQVLNAPNVVVLKRKAKISVLSMGKTVRKRIIIVPQK